MIEYERYERIVINEILGDTKHDVFLDSTALRLNAALSIVGALYDDDMIRHIMGATHEIWLVKTELIETRDSHYNGITLRELLLLRLEEIPNVIAVADKPMPKVSNYNLNTNKGIYDYVGDIERYSLTLGNMPDAHKYGDRMINLTKRKAMALGKLNGKFDVVDYGFGLMGLAVIGLPLYGIVVSDEMGLLDAIVVLGFVVILMALPSMFRLISRLLSKVKFESNPNRSNTVSSSSNGILSGIIWTIVELLAIAGVIMFPPFGILVIIVLLLVMVTKD